MQQASASDGNKQETVTLTKSQLQAILTLLTQIEDGTSSLSLEKNSYHVKPHSALQSPQLNEPVDVEMKPRSCHVRGFQSPKAELQSPNYMYQKFNSVQDLSTNNGTRTPTSRDSVYHEAPAQCYHVNSPIPEGNQNRLLTPNGNSPQFGRMTPVSSVPCFRRYHHRENQSEWDQKKQKMLEYQAMLDQQREDIARRKAEEKERKRKEDEALEKKLREQRERMRIEYEEEQIRQRNREELMEKKRQDVIQAIEKTSHEIRESKKAACKDTISLMSVDAVISASKVGDEQIKRTQSMYEVFSGDKHEAGDKRDKTFADVSIQTDYSLLLSWLFNMNERKDWEAFLQQREAAASSSSMPVAEEERKKRSETRAVTSPKATQTDCSDTPSSSSQTLSASPITMPNEKSKVSSVKVMSKKADAVEKVAAAAAGQHHRPVGQIRSRCKWNLNSGSKQQNSKKGETEVKTHGPDLRRRYTGIPNGSQLLRVNPGSSSKHNGSMDSVKSILNGEEGCGSNAGTRDFFTTGSEYHLSLSSTSPDASIDHHKLVSHRKSSPMIRTGKKSSYLPAIMQAAGTAEEGQNKKSMYARKKWMSHDDFGYSGSFVVDKNDGSCFSRMEEIIPINPFT